MQYEGLVGIVGVGHMGGACARAWLTKSLLLPEQLVLIERDAIKVNDLRGVRGWNVVTEQAKIRECELVFLATKPQDFAAAAVQLRQLMRPGQTIVSFLAGVPLADLATALGEGPTFVRVMPNINSTILAGMSVWFQGPGVPPPHAEVIERLLQGIGVALEVTSEGLIDAATAVSASGPGYIFYLIEHMVRAAEQLGFSREEADVLVAQTVAGSIAMWRESKLEPEELRAMVTSRGGTTAAALEVFERGYLGKILQAGMRRADERCRELAELAKSK